MDIRRGELWSRNLNIGNDVRVSALLIARIHGCSRVAVGLAIHNHTVCVQGAGVQNRVNLRERAARTGVKCSIHVITGNVR